MNRLMLYQFAIFGVEAIIVVLLLLVLLRLRSRFGLSPLYVTLGVFQPIQVLLASSLYAEILPGLIVSPGSAVMFTASLLAVLLVYILEDALETRKAIYGIILANLTMTLLLYLFGLHLKLPSTLNFLELPLEIFQQNARVMFFGTIILFADVLLIIFVYEMTNRKITKNHFLSIYLTLAIIIVFDSLGFYTGAFYGQENYRSILISGIIGKLGMALLFAAGASVYLRFFESREQTTQPFHDVFYTLTYRQKYEVERLRGAHAKVELKASEERFREIFNAASDAFFIHDMETGAILDVNRKMCEMFGVSREEALHSDVGIISSGVPPYTQEEAVGWMLKAAAGEPQLFEWQAKNKTGRLFWVEVNMLRAAIGPVDQIIVSVRDITMRKLADEKVQRINQELRTINRVILTCTTTLAVEELLNIVLDEALAITGLEGGTICFVTPEQTLEIVAHRETSEATLQDLTTHAIKVGECLCGECARDHRPLILTNREEVLKFSTREATRGEDIRFHAAFPLVAGERCLGVLCIFTRTDRKPTDRSLDLLETVSAQIALAIDNTLLYRETLQQASTLEDKVQERTADLNKARGALMNLVEDLNAANEKLKELDRLKSMFIASMSHELRTPLNSIIGFSGIILGDMVGPISEDQRDMLGRVSRAGKHLLALITDVIDIAKVESGKVVPYPKAFKLTDLVQEAVAQVEAQAFEKGLGIHPHLPEEPIIMHTDQRRLLQCLLNYLSNAIKFTEKGEITLAVERVGSRAREKGQEWVEISVRDTGIGIRQEDMNRLFGSFVRFETQLKTITPGTGLGLYLTKKLATEVLGGQVGAESQEGQGSRFWIRIPSVLDSAG